MMKNAHPTLKALETLTNQQLNAIGYFIHTMQEASEDFRNPLETIKCDNCSLEELEDLKRVYKGIYSNDMQKAAELYNAASSIVTNNGASVPDPKVDEAIIISMIYKLGIEAGKKEERNKKKKAIKHNT